MTYAIIGQQNQPIVKPLVDRLMNAGGWNSPAMPLRYIEASRIANDGIDLDDD